MDLDELVNQLVDSPSSETMANVLTDLANYIVMAVVSGEESMILSIPSVRIAQAMVRCIERFQDYPQVVVMAFRIMSALIDAPTSSSSSNSLPGYVISSFVPYLIGALVSPSSPAVTDEALKCAKIVAAESTPHSSRHAQAIALAVSSHIYSMSLSAAASAIGLLISVLQAVSPLAGQCTITRAHSGSRDSWSHAHPITPSTLWVYTAVNKAASDALLSLLACFAQDDSSVQGSATFRFAGSSVDDAAELAAALALFVAAVVSPRGAISAEVGSRPAVFASLVPRADRRQAVRSAIKRVLVATSMAYETGLPQTARVNLQTSEDSELPEQCCGVDCVFPASRRFFFPRVSYDVLKTLRYLTPQKDERDDCGSAELAVLSSLIASNPHALCLDASARIEAVTSLRDQKVLGTLISLLAALSRTVPGRSSTNVSPDMRDDHVAAGSEVDGSLPMPTITLSLIRLLAVLFRGATDVVTDAMVNEPATLHLLHRAVLQSLRSSTKDRATFTPSLDGRIMQALEDTLYKMKSITMSGRSTETTLSVSTTCPVFSSYSLLPLLAVLYIFPPVTSVALAFVPLPAFSPIHIWKIRADPNSGSDVVKYFTAESTICTELAYAAGFGSCVLPSPPGKESRFTVKFSSMFSVSNVSGHVRTLERCPLPSGVHMWLSEPPEGRQRLSLPEGFLECQYGHLIYPCLMKVVPKEYTSLLLMGLDGLGVANLSNPFVGSMSTILPESPNTFSSKRLDSFLSFCQSLVSAIEGVRLSQVSPVLAAMAGDLLTRILIVVVGMLQTVISLAFSQLCEGAQHTLASNFEPESSWMNSVPPSSPPQPLQHVGAPFLSSGFSRLQSSFVVCNGDLMDRMNMFISFLVEISPVVGSVVDSYVALLLTVKQPVSWMPEKLDERELSVESLAQSYGPLVLADVAFVADRTVLYARCLAGFLGQTEDVNKEGVFGPALASGSLSKYCSDDNSESLPLIITKWCTTTLKAVVRCNGHTSALSGKSFTDLSEDDEGKDSVERVGSVSGGMHTIIQEVVVALRPGWTHDVVSDTLRRFLHAIAPQKPPLDALPDGIKASLMTTLLEFLTQRKVSCQDPIFSDVATREDDTKAVIAVDAIGFDLKVSAALRRREDAVVRVTSTDAAHSAEEINTAIAGVLPAPSDKDYEIYSRAVDLFLRALCDVPSGASVLMKFLMEKLEMTSLKTLRLALQACTRNTTLIDIPTIAARQLYDPSATSSRYIRPVKSIAEFTRELNALPPISVTLYVCLDPSVPPCPVPVFVLPSALYQPLLPGYGYASATGEQMGKLTYHWTLNVDARCTCGDLADVVRAGLTRDGSCVVLPHGNSHVFRSRLLPRGQRYSSAYIHVKSPAMRPSALASESPPQMPRKLVDAFGSLPKSLIASVLDRSLPSMWQSEIANSEAHTSGVAESPDTGNTENDNYAHLENYSMSDFSTFPAGYGQVHAARRRVSRQSSVGMATFLKKLTLAMPATAKPLPRLILSLDGELLSHGESLYGHIAKKMMRDNSQSATSGLYSIPFYASEKSYTCSTSVEGISDADVTRPLEKSAVVLFDLICGQAPRSAGEHAGTWAAAGNASCCKSTGSILCVHNALRIESAHWTCCGNESQVSPCSNQTPDKNIPGQVPLTSDQLQVLSACDARFAFIDRLDNHQHPGMMLEGITSRLQLTNQRKGWTSGSTELTDHLAVFSSTLDRCLEASTDSSYQKMAGFVDDIGAIIEALPHLYVIYQNSCSSTGRTSSSQKNRKLALSIKRFFRQVESTFHQVRHIFGSSFTLLRGAISGPTVAQHRSRMLQKLSTDMQKKIFSIVVTVDGGPYGSLMKFLRPRMAWVSTRSSRLSFPQDKSSSWRLSRASTVTHSQAGQFANTMSQEDMEMHDDCPGTSSVPAASNLLAQVTPVPLDVTAECTESADAVLRAVILLRLLRVMSIVGSGLMGTNHILPILLQDFLSRKLSLDVGAVYVEHAIPVAFFCHCGVPGYASVLSSQFSFLLPKDLRGYITAYVSRGVKRQLALDSQSCPIVSSNRFHCRANPSSEPVAVLVSRPHLLTDARKLFIAEAGRIRAFSISYVDQHGTGRAPTNQFFDLFFNQIMAAGLHLWSSDPFETPFKASSFPSVKRVESPRSSASLQWSIHTPQSFESGCSALDAMDYWDMNSGVVSALHDAIAATLVYSSCFQYDTSAALRIPSFALTDLARAVQIDLNATKGMSLQRGGRRKLRKTLSASTLSEGMSATVLPVAPPAGFFPPENLAPDAPWSRWVEFRRDRGRTCFFVRVVVVVNGNKGHVHQFKIMTTISSEIIHLEATISEYLGIFYSDCHSEGVFFCADRFGGSLQQFPINPIDWQRTFYMGPGIRMHSRVWFFRFGASAARHDFTEPDRCPWTYITEMNYVPPIAPPGTSSVVPDPQASPTSAVESASPCAGSPSPKPIPADIIDVDNDAPLPDLPAFNWPYDDESTLATVLPAEGYSKGSFGGYGHSNSSSRRYVFGNSRSDLQQAECTGQRNSGPARTHVFQQMVEKMRPWSIRELTCNSSSEFETLPFPIRSLLHWLIEVAATAADMYLSRRAVVASSRDSGTYGEESTLIDIEDDDCSDDFLAPLPESWDSVPVPPTGLFPRARPPGDADCTPSGMESLVRCDSRAAALWTLGCIFATALSEGRVLGGRVAPMFLSAVLSYLSSLNESPGQVAVCTFMLPNGITGSLSTPGTGDMYPSRSDAEQAHGCISLRDLACLYPSLENTLADPQAMVASSAYALFQWTVLGSHPPIPLFPNGCDLDVDPADTMKYLDTSVAAACNTGIHWAVEAFARGLLSCVPIESLICLTPQELADLACGPTGHLWNREELSALIASNGYTDTSPTFCILLDVLSNQSLFPPNLQSAFIKWATGRPAPPPGGLRALDPPIRVTRRDGDLDALPSCLCCQHHIKLPPYTDEKVLYSKLVKAITFDDSFQLS